MHSRRCSGRFVSCSHRCDDVLGLALFVFLEAHSHCLWCQTFQGFRVTFSDFVPFFTTHTHILYICIKHTGCALIKHHTQAFKVYHFNQFEMILKFILLCFWPCHLHSLNFVAGIPITSKLLNYEMPCCWRFLALSEVLFYKYIGFRLFFFCNMCVNVVLCSLRYFSIYACICFIELL